MCIQSDSRKSGMYQNRKAIRLTPKGSIELRAAISQMDLLLQASHVDAGLKNLVYMLQHLQTLRQEIT